MTPEAVHATIMTPEAVHAIIMTIIIQPEAIITRGQAQQGAITATLLLHDPIHLIILTHQTVLEGLEAVVAHTVVAEDLAVVEGEVNHKFMF